MKNKRNRKLMSILLTLSMLVTLLVPMVGPASAATTYGMSSVNKIAANTNDKVGSLTITMDGPSAVASVGKYVYFDLPSSPGGYEIFPNANDASGAAVTTLLAGNAALVTGTAYPLNTLNGVSVSNGSGVSVANDISLIKTSKTQFTLVFANPLPTAIDSTNSVIVSIPMSLTVPSGVSGAVNLNASAPSSSTFSSGAITIDNVGTGTVTLAAESTPTIGSTGGNVGIIDVKEDTPGALKDNGGSALKLELPPGLTWDTSTLQGSLMWGGLDVTRFNSANVTTTDNGRKLLVSVPNGSSGASFVKIGAMVAGSFVGPKILVDDSTAKNGDITVTISGDATTTPSSIIIGRYGDYSSTFKAFSTTNIIAGQQGQDIGKLEIDEAIPGSLIPTRTITLTLPDNVKWSQQPQIDTDNSKNQGDLNYTWSVQNDEKTIKLAMTGDTTGSTDPANLVLKNMQVTPAPDFNGDVVVTVAGSEGMTGTVTLAKAAAPVTVSAASTPDVIIGKADQPVGDLTIKENAAGYISGTITYSLLNGGTNQVMVDSTTQSGDTTLTLKAPAGVTFDATPTVAVTEGDLQLESNGVSTDTTDAHEGLLYIKVKSSSTTASTLTVSGIKVTVDRTVPEGALKLSVRGNATNQTLSAGNAQTVTGTVNGVNTTITLNNTSTTETDSIFPGHKDVASVPVATCVTPAPNTTKATAVFKIGDTKFSLNGVDQTMDAAPYLKNDRTYLPLRFVAKAVGVTDSNIIWNGDDQSVTLIKGGSVVKLVVGDTTMTINGTPITMDVAPEIVDPGRTMLPVRWVAQALGCQINWDEATQSVTIN